MGFAIRSALMGALVGVVIAGWLCAAPPPAAAAGNTPPAAAAGSAPPAQQPPVAAPAAGTMAGTGSASGLPVPRFVTLRSGEVNVRTGPGVRYPVEWVFLRRDMPVEITAEFDTWRRIRDWEGSEGWVHQSMLSGRRAVMVAGEVRTIFREPSVNGKPVARAEAGVIGWLLRCGGDWCEVEMAGHRGWIRREEVWGVYRQEKVE